MVNIISIFKLFTNCSGEFGADRDRFMVGIVTLSAE